jgi:hypothetical protein
MEEGTIFHPVKLQCSYTPDKVLSIISTNTDVWRAFTFLDSFMLDGQKQFYSKISESDFEIKRKYGMGVTNSPYAPILSGEVRKDEDGSQVKFWIEQRESLTLREKINFGGLVFFSILIVLVFISDVFSRTIDFGIIMAFVVLGFLWGINKLIKMIWLSQAQNDKEILIRFVTELLK